MSIIFNKTKNISSYDPNCCLMYTCDIFKILIFFFFYHKLMTKIKLSITEHQYSYKYNTTSTSYCGSGIYRYFFKEN
jgi:hypothetical protein